MLSSQRISPTMRFCLLALFGLLIATALIIPTPLSSAASNEPAPCPAVVHPHMDPHRRLPAAVKTVLPAERHAQLEAAMRPAHSCVQKTVSRTQLAHEVRG